ncbi:MAG: type VI secretion system-associated protein TagF [Acetobacteraceae bacterium]|nr:type VI secretion system-associated protein TagF [Acetobacteraceae bacterium]
MSAGGAPRLGLVGKLPAHGDFVRRGTLPASFCAPWDAWLQDGIAAARATIGDDRWEGVWDSAPAWRFALPAGACGPEAVAGVLVPSRDSVGRRFPLTLAAVREGGLADWPASWFATLEGIARAALDLGQDADAVAAQLPLPGALPDPATDGATDPPVVGDPLAAFWATIAAENALEHAAAGAEQVETDQADIERAAAGAATAPPAADQADETVLPDAPSPDPAAAAPMADAAAPSGWWTAAASDGTPGLIWPLPALPAAEEFVLLLEPEA